MFILIKQVHRFIDSPQTPATKSCPYCCSKIDIKATRCPDCTSQLQSS